MNGTSSPNQLSDYVSEITCDNGDTNMPAGGTTLTTRALGYGDKVTCEITNHRKAIISGVKFQDDNSDGLNAADPADPGLTGWEIRAYTDTNGNGSVDSGETTFVATTTAAGGAYSFKLKAGSYVICEMLQMNWLQTKPAPATNSNARTLRGGAGGYPLTVGYGDVRAAKDFGNASFGSGSTMTNSAFQLVDDLAPWTITDFEILLNAQNTIVATNPGQFYYHQRATNTSGGTASMGYTINWPCQFQTQTAGGQPIHAYVQYASDSANVWRDLTPQSSKSAGRTNRSRLATKIVGGPAGPGHDHVNNVPAGAKVWVTVHLDYALKTTTATNNNFGNPPITYRPFQSTIKIGNSGVSYSSTSLLGRGKKVTVVYGRMTNEAGGQMPGVWVRLVQGSNSALALPTRTETSSSTTGRTVCLPTVSRPARTGSAWTFANGGNVSSKLEVLGDGGSASGSPTWPPRRRPPQ